MAHNIQLANDTPEVEAFRDWLITQGHTVTIGTGEGNFVDGVWTLEDETANGVIRGLWDAYSLQGAV